MTLENPKERYDSFNEGLKNFLKHEFIISAYLFAFFAFTYISGHLFRQSFIKQLGILLSVLLLAVIAINLIFVGLLLLSNKISNKFTTKYQISELFYNYITDRNINIFGRLIIVISFIVTALLYILEVEIFSAIFLIITILFSIFIFYR